MLGYSIHPTFIGAVDGLQPLTAVRNWAGLLGLTCTSSEDADTSVSEAIWNCADQKLRVRSQTDNPDVGAGIQVQIATLT